MRKIYVLDENNELKEIDAGITQYSELADSPIKTNTLNTSVSETGELVESTDHKWTEEELINFCNNAADGRYDIITEERGPELLLIHDTGTTTAGRQYRRITAQYDYMYSTAVNDWINISDTSRSTILFSWVTPPSTITYGAKTEIEYTYYNQSNRIGTIQLYVNNNLKTTVSRNSSTTPYTIDITNYLNVGDNNIELRLSSASEVDPLYASIKVINLILSSEFSEDKLYTGNKLNYTYSFSGSIDKTVYFKFDDLEPVSKSYTASATATNATQELDTSALSHGLHTLTVWGEAYIDDALIKTDSLYYTLPLWKDEAQGTIVAIKSAPVEIEEGATASIVYTPYNVNPNVQIDLIYPEEFGMENLSLNVLSGVQRTWAFMARTLSVKEGEDYIPWNLEIQSDGATVTLPLTVVPGEQINYDPNSLIYELDLIGRDNALSNRSIIEYNTISYKPEEVYATTANMLDFNYATDGWLIDNNEGGRNILRINATSWVTYENMGLLTLLSDTNNSGVTFEIDFTSRNATNSNKTLVSLLTNGSQGITINEQSVRVSLAGSIYQVEYKAEERIRIAVTVGRNIDDSRLVKIYLNGVLSYVGAYTSTSFNNYNTDLILNPSNGFIDIYGLRLYSSELTAGQVLNNYIASFNSSAEKIAERDWNDIYGDAEKTIVSFDKVKGLMPTFVFTTNDVNTTQSMPPAKGDKRFGPIQYIDEIYGASFTEEYKHKVDDKGKIKGKPEADVQGTSSQKYPRKNIKVKTNNEYSINSAVVVGEDVFTFKKDFMDSSHANNTGLAKLVQTLYFTPVPPQISYIMCQVDENSENDFPAVDKSGRPINFKYIYEYAESIGKPFSSLGAVDIEVSLLKEEVDGVTSYHFAYTKVGSSEQIVMCEIDNKDKDIIAIYIKDKSYIRTTIYGQPCAFFWEDKDGAISYQGIYNFNTDKVSTNNMELEKDGTMSFEFANNVTDGALFKSCENYTDVRNSFEYRAYEKDGISIKLWEDYYDDDLVKWANGGDDDGDAIPVLNALYNENDVQLYTKIGEELTPINYPLLTEKLEDTVFFGDSPEKLEVEYRLENDNIEAAYVASSAISDDFKLSETIEALGGDAYYEAHTELHPVPIVDISNPIGCQIINQDADYVLQWGYETDGTVHEWFSTVYIADLLTTIPEEHQSIVTQADVSASIKSGTAGTIEWNYKYPVEKTWNIIALANNIFDAEGNAVSPVSLRKYDLFEHIHEPIMRVINWVIDCWKEYETNKSLDKFLNEFNEHLNKEYVITYYVMALFAGAADSLAKNMFWNSYDGGNIWYPVYYDIDTCFGLSNDGHPNFPYSLEIYGEGSKLGTADIYNGAKSNFWKLVYAAFSSDIQSTYNKLRGERLTYEKVMDVLYGEQIGLIAPAHYNEDAKFSYLPYPTYYYTAQGNRYERLKYWVENRFDYLDSAMENNNYVSDSFELRSNAGLPITVKPDMDMYIGVKFGQDVESISKKRCLANGVVSFNPKDYGVTEMNDLETLIYGASHVISLGDLSQHQITSIKFPDNGISVLETIEIGSEQSGYINSNFKTLSVGKNSLLKVVNVGNCINLGTESSTLDLSQCPSIQQVYALNTKLTNIMLPEGSPIRILHLPYGVKNIELVNQVKLTDLVIEAYDNIETLVWENTINTTIKTETVLNNIYDISNNKLNTVRLIGYQPEESVTTTWMNWLMNKGGLDDTNQGTAVPYITGKISIKTTGIESIEFKDYITRFVEELGESFVFASTTNSETLETTYYRYDKENDLYIVIDDISNYKLELHLDQIVEDEYIFGVIGEGE